MAYYKCLFIIIFIIIDSDINIIMAYYKCLFIIMLIIID